MNNIITQKEKNIKRYLPHELKTREHAVKTYRNNGDIGYVCRKYHISRISLWRWNKKYDGTRESLADKSHKPHSKHPTEHTEKEIKWIKDLIKRNPHITLNEIWYKLKINKGYHTPKEIGVKWQIDVKYVPNECKTKGIPEDKRYYQYTCIDEASRERYLYWYEEHTPTNTGYYGYKIQEI